MGKRGGIVAGTLLVLPPLFILLALNVYVSFCSLPSIAPMLNGLKPAVIALVIVALPRVVRWAVRGPIQGADAVATLFFFDASLLVDRAARLGTQLEHLVYNKSKEGKLFAIGKDDDLLIANWSLVFDFGNGIGCLVHRESTRQPSLC
jgi:chromate transporter